MQQIKFQPAIFSWHARSFCCVFLSIHFVQIWFISFDLMFFFMFLSFPLMFCFSSVLLPSMSLTLLLRFFSCFNFALSYSFTSFSVILYFDLMLSWIFSFLPMFPSFSFTVIPFPFISSHAPLPPFTLICGAALVPEPKVEFWCIFRVLVQRLQTHHSSFCNI